MRRFALVPVVVCLALVAAACGASGDSPEEGESPTTTADTGTPAGGTSEGAFGDLDELCGPGDFSVAPDEAGSRGGDQLRIGVATDRASTVRPGLNKEMWDASIAFVDWCNEQGGVGGLQIDPIELSGALFDVEAAMTTACTDVFAMVGGGYAQDNLEFSGKDGSDFHRCEMIDIPAYAVSPEKADSNGQVQPVPNPGTTMANTWIRDFAELYPEAVEEAVVVYGELPALENIKDAYVTMLEELEIPVAGSFAYPVIGTSDWTPLARRVMDAGATTMLFVGEPANATALTASLTQQGWEGTPLFETNMYDPQIFAQGAEAVEGSVIRMTSNPLEEADRWPATQAYLDLMSTVDDGKVGLLGLQSISAWLLFVTAANACGEANDGVLDRTCILEQAAEQEDWTGGGLHGPTDPARQGEAETSSCGMLVIAKDGKFERLYPELGGEGDDVDGFHCPDDGVSRIPGAEGKAIVDPDRPI